MTISQDDKHGQQQQKEQQRLQLKHERRQRIYSSSIVLLIMMVIWSWIALQSSQTRFAEHDLMSGGDGTATVKTKGNNFTTTTATTTTYLKQDETVTSNVSISKGFPSKEETDPATQPYHHSHHPMILPNYGNFSCPFEMAKYTCFNMSSSVRKHGQNSLNFIQQNSDIADWSQYYYYYPNHYGKNSDDDDSNDENNSKKSIHWLFDEIDNHGPDNVDDILHYYEYEKQSSSSKRRPRPKRRIFFIGDSTMRQVFIALSCRLYRYPPNLQEGMVESDTHSVDDDKSEDNMKQHPGDYPKRYIDWANASDPWPCQPKYGNCISFGKHSGFSLASIPVMTRPPTPLNQSKTKETANREEFNGPEHQEENRRRRQQQRDDDESHQQYQRFFHEIHFIPIAGARRFFDTNIFVRWEKEYHEWMDENINYNQYISSQHLYYQQQAQQSSSSSSSSFSPPQVVSPPSRIPKFSLYPPMDGHTYPMHLLPQDIIVFNAGLHDDVREKIRDEFKTLMNLWFLDRSKKQLQVQQQQQEQQTIYSSMSSSSSSTPLPPPPPQARTMTTGIFPTMVYMTTFTQHFVTQTGVWDKKLIQLQQNESGRICRPTVPSNEYMETERKFFLSRLWRSSSPNATTGGSIPVEKRSDRKRRRVHYFLNINDTQLGHLHIGSIDCTHYCMPGFPDIVASRFVHMLSNISDVRTDQPF